MTVLVLDSGGVSGLATSPAKLIALREQGLWPPQVPVVVLVEALTGDQRRDFHTNRLLAACQLRAMTELIARDAALLRTRTGRPGQISAVDAVVVAYAASLREPATVLTSDPNDLRDLAAGTSRPVSVVPVQPSRRRG